MQLTDHRIPGHALAGPDTSEIDSTWLSSSTTSHDGAFKPSGFCQCHHPHDHHQDPCKKGFMIPEIRPASSILQLQ